MTRLLSLLTAWCCPPSALAWGRLTSMWPWALAGACGDPACPVLHEDRDNPIHPPWYVDSRLDARPDPAALWGEHDRRAEEG